MSESLIMMSEDLIMVSEGRSYLGARRLCFLFRRIGSHSNMPDVPTMMSAKLATMPRGLIMMSEDLTMMPEELTTMSGGLLMITLAPEGFILTPKDFIMIRESVRPTVRPSARASVLPLTRNLTLRVD